MLKIFLSHYQGFQLSGGGGGGGVTSKSYLLPSFIFVAMLKYFGCYDNFKFP